ncbi:hypothetical protein [Dehalobacterium formicoaceticum]|uniref:hypothetical protein n=1 Tax=Dehalobacterium formicoaceticum TaxID=51515 RepID=UPI0031F663DE
MNEMVKRLMLIELRNKGFTQARYDPEKDAIFPTPDYPKIEIHEDEIWYPNVTDDPPYILGKIWHSREEINAAMQKLVYNTLRPIQSNAVEMTAAWDKAAPMPIKDVAEFRLLSEYNNIVLAARDDGDYGVHFVTWQYSYNRKGVGQGHYTTHYEDAKKDFATRSGLIREKELFEPEQLKQIYSALLFQGKNDDELTFDTEQKLHDVIEKLENICPNLKNKPEQTEQEPEAEPALE